MFDDVEWVLEVALLAADGMHLGQMKKVFVLAAGVEFGIGLADKVLPAVKWESRVLDIE